MNLVIHAHTLKNEPLSQPITGRFDERGGTIGRSDSNTLSLPDPERHISRLQAEVWFANGAFSIRNVGSANPIIVNGRSIAPGEGANLSNADEITIGSYVMRAVIGSQDMPATSAPQAAVDSRTVIVSSAGESKTTPPRINTVGSVDAVGTQPSARFIPPPELTTMNQQKSAAPAVPPMPMPPVASAASVPAPASVDPFADLLGPSGGAGASASDPFADLLGPATPAAAPVRPASIPTAASLGSPTVAPGPAARLPDDFDPFADLAPPPRGPAGLDAFMTGTPAAPPPPAGALPADLGLGDLIGNPASGTPGASGGSLDTLFGLNKTSATSSDPLAAFMAAPAPAKDGAPASPASTDPLAFFGAAPAAEPAPALPADFDHTPELKGAYVPPAVQAPAPARLPAAEQTQFAPPQAAAAPARVPEPPTVAPAPRPSAGDILPATTMPAVRPAKAAPASDAPMTAGLGAPAPAVPAAPAPVTAGLSTPVTPAVPAAPATAPAAPHANAEPLWAAFCEGAGIKLTPPQGLNPELMRMIGQILAQSMDGTLKLMAVRATAKQEMRAQVTTIQSRNNNPLKFSPDAGAAIEQLLQPPMRGFMFGPAAVTEAMDDLLGHAIGTMAGMRAALEGVLKRFEPSQLEGKLSSGGVFDALLPMNRRAKLWELYLQHYERIHGEAQDDFHDLFGKAFIKAYEDQLDLLDEARNQNK